ncbi:hypothetical protein N7495_005435 [Penicillium taxi]|uniref:uncharacterized protein n=1 Tax=Penicillium taxi TaxID=168475 RepID=UPI00254516CE|nr:uncharacterized protein N7495_005435 [Penicillium taxi]KAJ5893744.1 hypothetical protein N7495_005435 [Penicillium taxi]
MYAEDVATGLTGDGNPIEDVITQPHADQMSQEVFPQSFQFDPAYASAHVSTHNNYIAANAPEYIPGPGYSDYQHPKDEQSAYYAQRGGDFGHQFTPAHPYSDSCFPSNNNFDPQQSQNSHQNAYSIPGAWKGQEKHKLLETLLDTISGCDEERVAQVVQVVRVSATPEEAVSGICQVLGIGSFEG